MEWKYNNPEFECDKLNYDLLKYAPWSGHRNFVYDYMCFFKPNKVVELGSHYGCSSFTFCQADKDFKLNTLMYFIDTWEGDDFTKKYDNDVYSIFRKTLDVFYTEQNAEMLRMTFDNALNKFEDNFFDLIHIDGSHYYDDIKRDFEKWLPKIKKDGVIILHDISEDIVLNDIMGSHKFWLELKKKYNFTIEFDFSWGLGIIFFDNKKYEFIKKNVDLSKYQRNNNALDVEFKDILRQNYFEIKDKQIYIDDLLKQKETLNSHLKAYKENENKKDKYIEELKNNYDNSLKETVEAYEQTKRETVEAYEQTISAYKKVITDYEGTVQGKDKYITELENSVSNLNEELLNLNMNYKKTLEYKIISFIKKFKR